MAGFIPVLIGNFVCYLLGTLVGRVFAGERLFGKTRAFLKRYKNGDCFMHVPTIGDDIAMISCICIHLEGEGYNMDDVKEAFEQAMSKNDTEEEIE